MVINSSALAIDYGTDAILGKSDDSRVATIVDAPSRLFKFKQLFPPGNLVPPLVAAEDLHRRNQNVICPQICSQPRAAVHSSNWPAAKSQKCVPPILRSHTLLFTFELTKGEDPGFMQEVLLTSPRQPHQRQALFGIPSVQRTAMCPCVSPLAAANDNAVNVTGSMQTWLKFLVELWIGKSPHVF